MHDAVVVFLGFRFFQEFQHFHKVVRLSTSKSARRNMLAAVSTEIHFQSCFLKAIFKQCLFLLLSIVDEKLYECSQDTHRSFVM